MKNQRLASIITEIHLLGEIWYNHLSAYAKEIAMNIIKIEFAKERIIPTSLLLVGRFWFIISSLKQQPCGGMNQRRGRMAADEIHSDLVLYGNKHLPLVSLDKAYQDHVIMLTSPGKPFNVAGLKMFVALIPNGDLQKAFDKMVLDLSLDVRNTFGMESIIHCYKQENVEWLEQMLAYIQENIDFTYDYVKELLPGVTFRKPEGNYLVWTGRRKAYPAGIFGSAGVFVRRAARVCYGKRIPYLCGRRSNLFVVGGTMFALFLATIKLVQILCNVGIVGAAAVLVCIRNNAVTLKAGYTEK